MEEEIHSGNQPTQVHWQMAIKMVFMCLIVAYRTSKYSVLQRPLANYWLIDENGHPGIGLYSMCVKFCVERHCNFVAADCSASATCVAVTAVIEMSCTRSDLLLLSE